MRIKIAFEQYQPYVPSKKYELDAVSPKQIKNIAKIFFSYKTFKTYNFFLCDSVFPILKKIFDF